MKNDQNDLMCLDIYLSQLPQKECNKIKRKLKVSNVKSMPLLSWDIFNESYINSLFKAKKKIELNEVLSLAKKFNWKNDLDSTFAESDYEALIITDADQNIVWVNDGFTEMTGYSKKFAINKTPKFLQGEKTSLETKTRIRKALIKDEPFKEIIINYKKDKTPYKCEVKIIPLYNETTTHYIAIERQVV